MLLTDESVLHYANSSKGFFLPTDIIVILTRLRLSHVAKFQSLVYIHAKNGGSTEAEILIVNMNRFIDMPLQQSCTNHLCRYKSENLFLIAMSVLSPAHSSVKTFFFFLKKIG